MVGVVFFISSIDVLVVSVNMIEVLSLKVNVSGVVHVMMFLGFSWSICWL